MNLEPDKIINGKDIASKIRLELAEKISGFISQGKRAPGLGVILVGDNPASKTYVQNKEKAARECGFIAKDIKLTAAASFDDVKKGIESFNNDKEIDGILLQLPLPKGLNSDLLISYIDPKKDADGLHPVNQGLLLQKRAVLKPCTPSGVIELLERSNIELSGKHAVVLGRSILVGKPISLMLLDKDCTVTMAHSKTKDLPAILSAADLIIAAIGVPEFVKGDSIKKGAVVIDVGINRLQDGKLVGDVDFNSAIGKVSMITPVPGGVGPMTIAMLLKNTFGAYVEREM